MEANPFNREICVGREACLSVSLTAHWLCLLQLCFFQMLKCPGRTDILLLLSKLKHEQDKMEAGFQCVYKLHSQRTSPQSNSHLWVPRAPVGLWHRLCLSVVAHSCCQQIISHLIPKKGSKPQEFLMLAPFPPFGKSKHHSFSFVETSQICSCQVNPWGKKLLEESSYTSWCWPSNKSSGWDWFLSYQHFIWVFGWVTPVPFSSGLQ